MPKIKCIQGLPLAGWAGRSYFHLPDWRVNYPPRTSCTCSPSSCRPSCGGPSGVKIKKGQAVFLTLNGAMHDEAVFPQRGQSRPRPGRGTRVSREVSARACPGPSLPDRGGGPPSHSPFRTGRSFGVTPLPIWSPRWTSGRALDCRRRTRHPPRSPPGTDARRHPALRRDR